MLVAWVPTPRVLICGRLLYYRAAHGFVIVYDVTSRESFANVRKWIEAVRRYGSGDSRWLIVGNKTDLESRRAVEAAEGRALADEFGCRFVEASASTSDNVETAFLEVARDVQLHRPTAPPDPPAAAVYTIHGTTTTAVGVVSDTGSKTWREDHAASQRGDLGLCRRARTVRQVFKPSAVVVGCTAPKARERGRVYMYFPLVCVLFARFLIR